MEQIEKIQGTEKEFIKVFQELCYSRSSWQVWADLMAAMACTLANSVDKTEPRHTAREKEYAECIKRLGGVEKPAKCFAIVVEALERNPDQDFLGKLYMSLELGNHWKGQFFTPYNVCECMASITINDNVQTLEKQEWISVNDPVCGDPLMPVEKPGQEFWYTPFYFRGEWNCRRQIQIFKEMCGSWITPIEERNPGKITFYFDFEKGDYKCQNS